METGSVENGSESLSEYDAIVLAEAEAIVRLYSAPRPWLASEQEMRRHVEILREATRIRRRLAPCPVAHCPCGHTQEKAG